MVKPERIPYYLDSLRLSGRGRRVRSLSILSAAIAVCRPELTRAILIYLKKYRAGKAAIYETILQSYLFLGFPRTIEGMLVFGDVFHEIKRTAGIEKEVDRNIGKWSADGDFLCRRVYGKNYYALRRRFTEIAPELFEWMVVEGYGKVLNRPGLKQIERELAEVAALVVDRRERQLMSHVIGSLNVGAPISLVRQVCNDIAPLAGSSCWRMADRVITKVENKYASQI